MFEELKPPLDDESLLSVLTLADKYECINLIKQCICETEITPRNVLQILPYVARTTRQNCLECLMLLTGVLQHQNWRKYCLHWKTTRFSTRQKMLLNKCRFLESSVVKMQDALFSLIGDCLEEINESRDKPVNTPTIKFSGWAVPVRASTSQTTSNSRCDHTIKVREINEAKNCPHCKEKYKEKFLARIPCCKRNTQHYFDMLRKGDDVATAVQNCS